jgi:drug/metabolite transporter (DMT)-like permease
MYGININMVRRHLHEIASIQIASLALSLNAIPAVIVLYFTGYFQQNLLDKGILFSTGYSFILGVCGTALASVMFYMLIKRAGTVFSSMVTYAIPIVAIGWGIVYGEKIGWKQVASLAVILTGVWFANRTKKIAT